MANTPNIDLVKPAGTDHALVSVLNSNSDKIDTFAGSTNQAIANISVNIQHMTDATIISDLDDIPVGTQGRVKLASALRPNSDASLYDYNCHGEGTTRTLIVSSEYFKRIWVNYKNGSTWSGWNELVVNSTKIAVAQSITTSTTLTYTGVSVTIPAGKEFAILVKATYRNNEPLEIALSTSNSAIRTYNTVARSDSASTISFAGYTDASYIGSLTLYVWAKYASSGSNDIDVSGYYR